MRDKSKNTIVRLQKQKRNKWRFYLFSVIAPCAATIIWLLIVTFPEYTINYFGSAENRYPIRIIDEIERATAISTAAENELKTVYENNPERITLDENTRISRIQFDGSDYINMVSLKKNWEGRFYYGGFGGNQVSYNLRFKFDETKEHDINQRFGIYFLSSGNEDTWLGFRFTRLDEKGIDFDYIFLKPKETVSGVTVSGVLVNRKLPLDGTEFQDLSVTLDEKNAILIINGTIRYVFPKPGAMKQSIPIFFPFVVNSNVLFRLTNVMVEGEQHSEIFPEILKETASSNIQMFKNNYRNEDIQSTPPFDRYVYKMPVMNDYRNALAGITPFTMEFPISKLSSPLQLRFGYSILDQSWPGGVPVRFRVSLKNEDTIRCILDDVIAPDQIPENNHWKDVLLNPDFQIEKFSSIEFRAETVVSERTDAWIGWSNPVIFAPGLLRRKPNILLISMDTVRWDRLSTNGYSRETTANIDMLAKEGTVFTQCVSQASWTTPSHISIMTSQYPSIHGVIQPITERFRKLAPLKITLAEVLREKGYETVAFTGHSAGIYGKFGLYQGFNQYRENGDLYRSPHDIEIIVPRVVDWLKRFGKARPFFMFLHTFETHLPFTNAFYAGDSVDFRNKGQYHAHLSDLYDGDLRFTDEHLGNVFDELRNLGIMDNTIVIITSDHGYVMPGEHGAYEGYSDNLYEGCIRVPLIMRFPAKIPANTIVKNQVRLIDIAPTILDLLGHRNHPEFQGTSLLSLMHGEKTEPIIAYAEAMNAGPERKMMRTDLFKYIFIPEMIKEKIEELEDAGKNLAQRELFDLADDPWEAENLAPAKPDVTREFQRFIDDFIRAGKGVGNDTRDFIELQEEDIRKLRDLGYIK